MLDFSKKPLVQISCTKQSKWNTLAFLLSVIVKKTNEKDFLSFFLSICCIFCRLGFSKSQIYTVIIKVILLQTLVILLLANFKRNSHKQAQWLYTVLFLTFLWHSELSLRHCQTLVLLIHSFVHFLAHTFHSCHDSSGRKRCYQLEMKFM